MGEPGDRADIPAALARPVSDAFETLAKIERALDSIVVTIDTSLLRWAASKPGQDENHELLGAHEPVGHHLRARVRAVCRRPPDAVANESHLRFSKLSLTSGPRLKRYGVAGTRWN